MRPVGAVARIAVALRAVSAEVQHRRVAVLGLGAAGALELLCGIRNRGRHLLARDWIASGVIGLGAHALLGVAGGGAIISGVLWILSGLTLRHDARSGAGKP